MSAEWNENSHPPPSLTPRDLAAHCSGVPDSSPLLLDSPCWRQCFSSISHPAMNRTSRHRCAGAALTPSFRSHPPSAMDFTHPDITEEELNSEVELLRDQHPPKQVVEMAGPVSVNTSDLERPAETEHAVRQLARRFDVEHSKSQTLSRSATRTLIRNEPPAPWRRFPSLYVQRHTNLQRPPGEMPVLRPANRGIRKAPA